MSFDLIREQTSLNHYIAVGSQTTITSVPLHESTFLSWICSRLRSYLGVRRIATSQWDSFVQARLLQIGSRCVMQEVNHKIQDRTTEIATW